MTEQRCTCGHLVNDHDWLHNGATCLLASCPCLRFREPAERFRPVAEPVQWSPYENGAR